MREAQQVLLAHGSGGMMMRELIDELFLEAFDSEELRRGDDAAVLPLPNAALPSCESALPTAALAFTTDSFVVTPHFFPGGDIGRLAVCGTVNDLATSGAHPMWLSVGFILEEGFALDSLRRICHSIAAAAAEADVRIVTGDTKVVNRGHADGIYINTSGIGLLPPGTALSGANCQPGDQILVSGSLGDHGIAIISAREQLGFHSDLESDAAPLNHLVQAVLTAAPNVRTFRDPTRGGLASTLNELAEQSAVLMFVDEDKIPVKQQVRGACDLLGFDVLQVANEGKMVCVVPAAEANAALDAMRSNPYGSDAAIIGEVCALGGCGHTLGASALGAGAGGKTLDTGALGAGAQSQPTVFVRTAFGSQRILDMLVGEQLPRIC